MASFTYVPGSVTKCWHFTIADATQGRREHTQKIMLRHNQITGNRYLMLNGAEVLGSRGATSILSQGEILFKVEDEDAKVVIVPDLTRGFVYGCVVGGRTIPELANVLETEDSLVVKPVSARVPDVLMHSSEGKQVVNYRIITALTSEGQPNQEASVHRRYKEFEKLQRLLRSAFAGTHLANSLPSLPGKVLNPFTDQTTKEFIGRRRADLEVYINKVINFPKAIKNPDVLKFLGLDPVTGTPLDPMDAERFAECKF